MNHTRTPTEVFTVIVGEGNQVTDPALCAEFAVDGVVPQCVVPPRSEGEVARVLKRASEHELAVIPCRNATKLGIGNIPRDYSAALCLRNMGKVTHFEPADLTISVEPGMELSSFQRIVGQHGLWIPLDPAGGGRASLGGIVATNASGPLRLKYGAPRDHVLGMKVATTEGNIVKIGGRVVKNVAGYDLSKLLVGSFGTLGVIVEISLKLFPLPANRSSWRVSATTLDAAREFRIKILQSPLGPLRMVLLDAPGAAIAKGNAPDGSSGDYEIWVEFGGSERVLDRSAQTLRELERAAGVTAQPLEGGIAEAGWDRISDFVSVLHGSRLIILKATLPIASSEGFVRCVADEAEKAGARHACFCQNGVGIVHACLWPEKLSPAFVTPMVKLRDEARQRCGALVIERCPAEIKKGIDVWGTPGNDFPLMHKLKELWDPKGTLSPGRFVGGL